MGGATVMRAQLPDAEGGSRAEAAALITLREAVGAGGSTHAADGYMVLPKAATITDIEGILCFMTCAQPQQAASGKVQGQAMG